MIKLATSKQRLINVAEEWKATYSQNGKWGKLWEGYDTGEIHKKLLVAKTLEEAEVAIGNNSWTRIYCDECSAMVDVAAWVGHREAFCYDCLKKALTALDKYNIYGKIPDTEAQE